MRSARLELCALHLNSWSLHSLTLCALHLHAQSLCSLGVCTSSSYLARFVCVQNFWEKKMCLNRLEMHFTLACFVAHSLIAQGLGTSLAQAWQNFCPSLAQWTMNNRAMNSLASQCYLWRCTTIWHSHLSLHVQSTLAIDVCVNVTSSKKKKIACRGQTCIL